MQSYEEGKDIEPYKDVFQSIANLPHGKMKEKLCDVLYTVVMNCPQRSDYKYIEPSDLEEIKLLRRPHEVKGTVDKSRLESKIHGACSEGPSRASRRTSLSRSSPRPATIP